MCKQSHDLKPDVVAVDDLDFCDRELEEIKKLNIEAEVRDRQR